VRLLMFNPFRFIIPFVLVSVFCLVSCDDLAVSQRVNDLDQIIPTISLTGSLNNQTRSFQSRISVLLKNKNDNAVEIEGGAVRVNGYTMTPPSVALLSPNKHDDYVFYGDIIPDELYLFEIVLSNDQTYRAWIESPEIFPTILEVPERIDSGKNMVVNWQNTDFRYPQFLILQYYDADKGFSEENQIQLKIDEPYYGRYTVDKKYIKYQNIT